jgi:hypothetical protein
MKKKHHKKTPDLPQDQPQNEEEHHRRLWLQYVLQTPMPWPRKAPSSSNLRKNPYGKNS